MGTAARLLAVVTNAASGMGYEIARCCAENGFDLLVVADEPGIHNAAQALSQLGVSAEAVEADLSTEGGLEKAYRAIQGRNVEALLASAGRGLGRAFLDQDLDKVRHIIDTSVTGMLCLLHKVGTDMRGRGHGRILITGASTDLTLGGYQAVYGGTKAFLESFSFALRNELQDSGVTVTCLMPGEQTQKDEPAEMAKAGFAAMMQA